MLTYRLKTSLHFLAVAVLVCGMATATEQARSADGDAKNSTQRGPENINDSVYKIEVFADFYNPYRETKKYTATGIIVKSPNIILTSRVTDPDGNDLFVRTTRLYACEREIEVRPDAGKSGSQAEKDKDKAESDDQLNRFKEVKDSKKEGNDKLYKQKLADNDKIKPINCVDLIVNKVDTDRSLVLLEATDKLTGVVPNFNLTEPEVGARITAYGFPISTNEMTTRRSSSAERQQSRLIPTITSGTVAKTISDKKDGQLILHQAPVSSGAKGGPVVNACNQVVGINVSQPSDWLIKAAATVTSKGPNKGQANIEKVLVPSSGLTAAIGAREIQSLSDLRDLKINFENRPCTASPTSFTAELAQNQFTLFLVGGALLLATAAMVIALRRPGPVRNTVARIVPGMSGWGNRNQHEAPTGYGEPDGYADAGNGRNVGYAADTYQQPAVADYGNAAPPMPKLAAPTQFMPDGGVATTQMDVGAKLIAISGGQAHSLDSRRLALGLTLGRDQDCDVVIDNSTVSKHHCKVSATGNGKLQIEDLGSANGTWRGRQRIQREAFGNGDVVRFGSVEYRLELAGGKADHGAAPTVVLSPVRAWMLSGFDEEGKVVQWSLQPTVDGSGRETETAWIIGRNSERADKVLADKRVSGEHAKLRFTSQRGLEICDLGSSNGTKVDGRKIADSFVNIDDARVVEFGGAKMSLSKS